MDPTVTTLATMTLSVFMARLLCSIRLCKGAPAEALIWVKAQTKSDAAPSICERGHGDGCSKAVALIPLGRRYPLARTGAATSVSSSAAGGTDGMRNTNDGCFRKRLEPLPRPSSYFPAQN
jgi:hypothetical protein